MLFRFPPFCAKRNLCRIQIFLVKYRKSLCSSPPRQHRKSPCKCYFILRANHIQSTLQRPEISNHYRSAVFIHKILLPHIFTSSGPTPQHLQEVHQSLVLLPYQIPSFSLKCTVIFLHLCSDHIISKGMPTRRIRLFFLLQILYTSFTAFSSYFQTFLFCGLFRFRQSVPIFSVFMFHIFIYFSFVSFVSPILRLPVTGSSHRDRSLRRFRWSRACMDKSGPVKQGHMDIKDCNRTIVIGSSGQSSAD